MKSVFSKYFPLPKFLLPEHIGLSFSDSNVKVVSKDRSIHGSSFKSLIIPLDGGVIHEGKIKDSSVLSQSLSKIREHFGSPFVFFTIPDELTYTFSADIQIEKNVDATEGVAFILEENAPLSLNDAIFDFEPTGIAKSESGFTASVVVSACAESEISKYVEALKNAALEPIGCISESQAIAHAVISDGDKGVCSIVHSRQNRVGIYLVKDGIVKFSTLRSTIGEDFKKTFLDEYDKFLEYSTKYSANGEIIKTVFVCGEFEYAQKTVEALSESANRSESVKLSNVWSNLLKIEKNTPNISYEDSLNLAGPIGSLLSSIIK